MSRKIDAPEAAGTTNSVSSVLGRTSDRRERPPLTPADAAGGGVVSLPPTLTQPVESGDEKGRVPAGLHDPLSLDVPTPAQLLAEYERLLAEGHEMFTAAEAASAAGDWNEYGELCSADSLLTNRAWYYRDRAERMLVGAGDPAPWKLTVGELAAHVAEGRLMDGSQSWADVQAARADGMVLVDQDRRMVEFLCDDDPALIAKVLAGQSFTVYRATNAEIGIFPGAYVTPHRDYAEKHLDHALGGAGHVIAQIVTSADLVVGHSANEFHFAPRNLAAWHESVVAMAVDDGRQVPEKVLAAYPELAAKAANCCVATADAPRSSPRAVDRRSRDVAQGLAQPKPRLG